SGTGPLPVLAPDVLAWLPRVGIGSAVGVALAEDNRLVRAVGEATRELGLTAAVAVALEDKPVGGVTDRAPVAPGLAVAGRWVSRRDEGLERGVLVPGPAGGVFVNGVSF